MLGVPAMLAENSQAGTDDLDSWIRGACGGGRDGGAAGARVALLVRFLYQVPFFPPAMQAVAPQ